MEIDEILNSNLTKSDKMRRLFDEGKTMFFEERNGAIALTHTCPQVGGLYDGSDI